MLAEQSHSPLQARLPWSGELEGEIDTIRSDDSRSLGSQVPARFEVMIAGVQGRAEQMIARVLGGFRYGSTALTKRRFKQSIAPAAKPSSRLEDALPETYGNSRVVLLVIDPYHVHVYWELTAQDRLDAKERLNPADPDQALTWVLRFYDVTGVEFDAANAHAQFDIVVKPGARSWYLELWSPNKEYFVELGPRAQGRFVPVCRSRPIQVPPAQAGVPQATADQPASPGPAAEPEDIGLPQPEAVLFCEPSPSFEPFSAPAERLEALAETPALGTPATCLAELPPTRTVALGQTALESSHSAGTAPEQRLEPSRSTSLVSESSGSGSAWQPPK